MFDSLSHALLETSCFAGLSSSTQKTRQKSYALFIKDMINVESK